MQIANQKAECMTFIVTRLKAASSDMSGNESLDTAKALSIMRKTLMKCLLEVARSYSEASVSRINILDFTAPLLTSMTDSNPGKSLYYCCTNAYDTTQYYDFFRNSHICTCSATRIASSGRNDIQMV